MKALKISFQMLITAIAVLCICLFLFDKCNNDVENVAYNGTDSLKQVIAEQLIIKDSLLVESKKKDTIRVEVIKKYRILKTDTIYAICDPIIQLCDSIILIDSSQIVDLKHVIKLDSVIIGNYKKIAHNDSISIVGLVKEVSKHKRHKKWLFGALGIVAVIAVVK